MVDKTERTRQTSTTKNLKSIDRFNVLRIHEFERMIYTKK